MKSRNDKPQEELFPFVEMAKLVPENHILRLIDRYVDFSFIDDLVDHTYSDVTGRPANDPELMVRILTLGYLYNLSERRLFEDLQMHAAYRWFCNLGFHEKIPSRSALNRLRNHRWAQDGIFEKIMQNIVAQCAAAGLVSGKHLAVDGTKVRANASIKSLEPIEIEVEMDEYLGRLKLNAKDSPRMATEKNHDDKNFRGTKYSNKTHRSTTDSDSRLFRKSAGQETTLSYVANDLIDTKGRVILDTLVTQPGISTECDAALEMIDQVRENGLITFLQTLTADKGYGTTDFITKLLERNITPHIPLLAKDKLEAEPLWETNTYIPDHLQKRIQKIKDVRTRNHVRKLTETPDYKRSQKLRIRVEHIFGEAKICHGLARARCRGLSKMQQQACMTATVQNIKRLVGHMRRKFRNTSVNALPRPPVSVFLCGFMAEFR